MTKRIIVPTDFSDNALIAAKYACHIASKQGYGIYLFHCFNSKTTIFDEKINEKEAATPILKGDLIIREWKDELSSEFPNLTIETETRSGLITDVLPKFAQEPSFSLIVIGSNGLDQNDSPVFGSRTTQIATESKIPVIAVPFADQKNEISKAAVLTNFKEDELASLKEFSALLGTIAELDVIHVYQNSDDISEVELQISQWAEKVRNIVPNTTVNTILKPIDYSNQEKDTIGEVVNITINENYYDIVIVTKTRKSFFDKWFSRSISKEVIAKLETTIFFDNN